MKKFILIIISILIFLNLAISMINLYTYIKYTKQVIKDISQVKEEISGINEEMQTLQFTGYYE
jgi:CHASE3 domain sensor protein